MVVGGVTVVAVGVGFGIAGIPPVRLNPARVAVQSLFGSCCLRYAASASKGTITGICVIGVGCNRCGLGGRDSAVALTSVGLSSVVDVGLLVAFSFVMGYTGCGSLFLLVIHGGFRSGVVFVGERMQVSVCKVKGSRRLGIL